MKWSVNVWAKTVFHTTLFAVHQIQSPITLYLQSFSQGSFKIIKVTNMRKVDSHLLGLPSVKEWEREDYWGTKFTHSSQYISSMFCLTCVICCAVCLSTVDPDSIQGCMSRLGRECVWSEREGSAWVSKAVGSSVVYLRQGGGTHTHTHTLLTHTGHEPHRGEWLHTHIFRLRRY